MAIAGGIDLGGTKIEARLFGADWEVLDSRRIETPHSSYQDMLRALVDQIEWLTQVSEDDQLPVGVGFPGIVDRETGKILTANLPATGHRLPQDLSELAGRNVVCMNDCQAFVLSEAQLGAGREFGSVLGLIMGTGLAVGCAINGQLVEDPRLDERECGHSRISASTVERHELPLLKCGCGRIGCYETLASGPGLSHLAKHLTGRTMLPEDFAKGEQAATPEMVRVLDIWALLIAELVAKLVGVCHPDCIVLGGGVSQISGVAVLLQRALANTIAPESQVPVVLLAQGGASSGARGAALAALNELSND